MQSKNKFTLDLLAGGVAGITAKTLTAPIQRVKLLLQTEGQNAKLKFKYGGIVQCFTRCVHEEGVLSLWRGNGVNVIRYFPTQALNFAFKDFYGGLLKVKQRTAKGSSLAAYIIAGGMAGSTTTCFVHPLDFARTRLAVDLGKSITERQYSGLVDCLKKVVRSDTVLGLYNGFVVAVLSIFMYRGLYFGLYDYGKEHLLSEKSPLVLKMVWAQLAVIIAEQLAYPGDTIKRKLFMQACKKTRQYSGTIDCFVKVYQSQGIRGLWKGSYSNILRGIGSSLCLIFYDQIKRIQRSVAL